MQIVAWRYRPTIGVDKFQWRLTEVPPWKWGRALATESEPLYSKSKHDGPTSADVIAGLEMALSQAAAMIERQQHVMQRAMDAWDTTVHNKSHDGMLWQCMEELRGEIKSRAIDQNEVCPVCGSECNERDELVKAEREIETLRAALAATVKPKC